jgi:threonine dehydrogenase-like Zn-dependent dehydrogenase
VGQFAIKSAYMLGAERVIAIDRFDYRLGIARDRAGAEMLPSETATNYRSEGRYTER